MTSGLRWVARLIVLVVILSLGYWAVDTLFFQFKSITILTWIAFGLSVCLAVFAFIYSEWVFGDFTPGDKLMTLGWRFLFWGFFCLSFILAYIEYQPPLFSWGSCFIPRKSRQLYRTGKISEGTIDKWLQPFIHPSLIFFGSSFI